MRTVFHLDTASVEARAVAERGDRRARIFRLLSFPLAPLLGLAPARVQRRWRDSWGFPAGVATSTSALVELAVGGLGLVQLLALVFGADWFLPETVRSLALIGPVLAAEAIVRLVAAAAQNEPVGSVLGVPLALLERPGRRRDIPDRGPPASIVRTTALTAVMCIAPRMYQERWARHLGLRPAWLTLLGAGAELLGGWVNLERGSTGDGLSSLSLNLLFVVEGVARLAMLVATGRPVGTVLGWCARPLLARMMPGVRDEEHRR
jgi:hypothetical protein